MTLPDERTRAVMNVKQFLYSLTDRKKNPRISKKIRIEAFNLLKHYPGSYDMEEAAKGAPDTFGSLEAVTWKREYRPATYLGLVKFYFNKLVGFFSRKK